MSDSILQVNQIKDKGGNATGITVADSTANVTINNLAGGAIGSAVNFPAGHVINVRETGSFADTSQQTTATWTSTNMTLTITPTSTSSKILILATAIQRVDTSGALGRAGYRVLRTKTGGDGSSSDSFNNSLGTYEHVQVRGNPVEISGVGGYMYLDSPGVDTLLTYTMQMALANDSGASYVWLRGSTYGSKMILMEITG